MADNRDFDFQIGDLCFRGATSDRFPYVRATAPFRKEQFDSSGRAGDQSLTGWWTRGQLSFHKGAGLNYYEVQAGDEALSRFEISDEVDPWVPGEVTLAGETVFHATATAPATVYSAAYWGDFLFAVDDYNTGGTFYKDGVAVTHASASDPQCCAVTTYLGGRVIVGVARDIEVMLPTSAGPTSNLWVNNDMAAGDNYTHLFWAKDRIWGVSSDGVWYVLDHAGGTVASGGPERFWEDELSFDWNLTDTPGGVYISRDQYVWLVTVDPDTGALSTPRIVADLGDGASIQSIKHNRGYLGICTERGFLVGAIQDSGDLTLGPVFVKYPESNCKSIVANGTSFFFLAVHEDNHVDSGLRWHSVYEVNLVDEVATLQPAWTMRHQFAVHCNGTTFCFPTSGSSQYVAVGNAETSVAEAQILGPFLGEDYASAGSVTTAYHRFGTLDPKHFNTVTVRAKGTGNIYVWRVDADGTQTQLTMDDGSEWLDATLGEGIFPLGLTEATERIALKIVLNRTTADAKEGPILLGYQIKALPVPERQRILRWPLLLHDVVRLRRGAEVGTQGKALTNLQAIEALESSAPVVTFTDHRTGETGTAYIDSVEFQSDTPSSKTTDGFGGIAYLTLRVIS